LDENNSPASGINVRFYSNIGTIAYACNTDTTGIATVLFWDSGDIGTATIIASILTDTVTTQVTILPMSSIEENVNFSYELNNYPNPFNPTTSIEFSLPQDSKVGIEIYNVKGQKVNELVKGYLTKGKHSIKWNGNDKSGKHVGSGVYYYKLRINDKTEITNKCLLMK
jgi:hypothetical protein